MTDVLSSPVVYGGTYRAVCLEVLTDRARVQIPQIFATEIVTVYNFAGPIPVAGDEGWVMFESGQAEHPIWVGSEGKDITGPQGEQGEQGEQGPPGPAPVSAYAYAVVQATTTTGAELKVMSWSQVAVGSLSGFSIVSSTNLRCNIAGRYRVAYQISHSGALIAYGVGRITHFNQAGATLAIRDVVNPGHAASAWSTWFGEGVFDMAVNDYIQISVQGETSTSIDTRSFVEITPVGGAKGDIGPAGPSIPGVAEHPPVWVPLTLGTGWSNYGGGFQTPRVTRKHGVVQVEGLIASAAGAAAIITTLPLGYRPAATLIFLTHAANTSGASRMDISGVGDLTSLPIPIGYASMVASFAADPAYGIEVGYDAPILTLNAADPVNQVDYVMPGGTNWQNGTRITRPQRSGTIALARGQYGSFGTFSSSGGQTSFASAYAIAIATRSTATIPAWVIGRDASDVLSVTDIREWF